MGFSVVIQNRNEYLEEGCRQLKSYKFFNKMDRDVNIDHRIKIQGIVSQLYSDGEITEKTYQFDKWWTEDIDSLYAS